MLIFRETIHVGVLTVLFVVGNELFEPINLGAKLRIKRVVLSQQLFADSIDVCLLRRCILVNVFKAHYHQRHKLYVVELINRLGLTTTQRDSYDSDRKEKAFHIRQRRAYPTPRR